MGSKKITILSYIFLFQFVLGQNMSDPDSLDSLIYDYSLKRIENGRSGIYYNISLPGNFSGIEISIVRLRSSTLWLRGANFSFFNVPPRTLPRPFARRIALVYSNLGNLSSFYYNVPNYTLITPVLGLMAYDTTNISRKHHNNNGSIGLFPMKDPILVHFPWIEFLSRNDTMKKKCVRFGNEGEIEFSNVVAETTNSCVAGNEGHFSIVIPYEEPQPRIEPSSKPKEKSKKQRLWKWWEIGFGIGILGLILLVCFGIFLYKVIRKKRIAKMEKESERNEALDSIWIGSSRMPSASGIRTQPVLENSYVP